MHNSPPNSNITGSTNSIDQCGHVDQIVSSPSAAESPGSNQRKEISSKVSPNKVKSETVLCSPLNQGAPGSPKVARLKSGERHAQENDQQGHSKTQSVDVHSSGSSGFSIFRRLSTRMKHDEGTKNQEGSSPSLVHHSLRKGSIFSSASSVESNAEQKRSHEIDAFLKKEKSKLKDSQHIPKVLLLGAADSGKSTLLKQLKIMYGNGFTNDERIRYRNLVVQSIVNSISVLLSIVCKDETQPISKHSIDGLSSEEPIAALAHCNKIIKLFQSDFELGDEIPQNIKDALLESAKEPGLLFCLTDGQKIHHLPETTSYFILGIEQCLDPVYMPSDNDILLLRVPTYGISLTVFHIDNLDYHFIDVSGSTKHRKAYINSKLSFFDDVNTILFVASLAGFDQFLQEESTVNRLADAISLFEDVTKNAIFLHTHVILFLNKMDLFFEKALTNSLHKFFPLYQGPEFESKEYYKFIQSMFLKQDRSRPIKVHMTCATDTKAMQVIIGEVIAAILYSKLSNVGLLVLA